MEKLVVDKDGKITIPPDVLAKRGLRPGDELELVEAAEGLLVYQSGVDEKTADWWNNLSEEDRAKAQTEARGYEFSSEKERDAIWNEAGESLEREAEGDEIDLLTR